MLFWRVKSKNRMEKELLGWGVDLGAVGNVGISYENVLEVLEPEERAYYVVRVLDVNEVGNKYKVQCLSGIEKQESSITNDDDNENESDSNLKNEKIGSQNNEEPNCDENEEDEELYHGEQPQWVPKSCVSFRQEPVSRVDFENRSEFRYSSAAHKRALVNNGTEGLHYFEPQEGDALEVRCRETASGPIGFREGYLNAIIDGFYHITYPDGSDEMVERERIRAAGFRTPADFVKQSFQIPESLVSAVLSTKDTLEELQFSLGVQRIFVEGYNTKNPKISVVGEMKQMKNVPLAIEIHCKRAADFARLSGLERRLNARLQNAKLQRETAVSLVFDVAPDVIGSCIGKNGVHLKAAQRLPGVVSVRVEDLDGFHRIEIMAETEEAAEAARDLVDHIRVRIHVSREEIGPLIGKKGVHLREIEQRAAVSKFILVEFEDDAANKNSKSIEDPNTSTDGMLSPVTSLKDEDASDKVSLGSLTVEVPYFETVGPRKQVAFAMQLFNMHRTYLSKQRELENKVKELRDSLAKLGAA
uniref:K Homology domain-containing protein n=1 Tax=Timspurckia oligopyrenoides TaxID=708627 RepID=A0A7S0ZIZ1_9RHOD